MSAPLPLLVLDTLGRWDHRAYLVYHRLLEDLRREQPPSGAAVQAALGLSRGDLKRALRTLRDLGLVQVEDGRAWVTCIGDARITESLRQLGGAIGIMYDGSLGTPAAPFVDYPTWVADRRASDGRLTDRGHGFAPTWSVDDAWDAVRQDLYYWRQYDLRPKKASTPKPRPVPPVDDPRRTTIENLQALANSVWGTEHAVLSRDLKPIGTRYRTMWRALAEWGYTPEQLEQVIRAAAADEWWVTRKLLDTSRVFSKPERIDQWLGVSHGGLLQVGSRSEAETF